MADLFPSLFLVAMIALTLALLPLLNDDRAHHQSQPITEELHIKPQPTSNDDEQG